MSRPGTIISEGRRGHGAGPSLTSWLHAQRAGGILLAAVTHGSERQRPLLGGIALAWVWPKGAPLVHVKAAVVLLSAVVFGAMGMAWRRRSARGGAFRRRPGRAGGH